MKNDIKFYEKGSIEILYGKSMHTFPLHSHESFCIGSVIDGDVLFKIDNEECLLSKSMAYIIPSDTGVYIEGKTQYTYLTICLKNELKDKFKEVCFKNHFFKMSYNEELFDLCNSFIKDNNERKFISKIEILINKYIKTKPINIPKKNQLVEDVKKYINNNIDKKFNLDEIAQYVHSSKYYITHIFKKQMGVTAHQYYIQAKLRFIRNNVFLDKKLIDLAMKLNFSDQSHLCRLFKKQMGISIQDYKKNIIRK